MRFFGFQTLLKQCQILYFSILIILLETLESPVQWVRIPFLNLLISHQFSFYCFNLVQLIHSKNLHKLGIVFSHAITMIRNDFMQGTYQKKVKVVFCQSENKESNRN